MDTNLVNNVIIPLVSALIGGTVSLYIFKLGLVEKEKEERKKKITSHYETERYFFLNIESLLIFTEKQIDEIINTSQKTKDWNINDLGLPLMSELKLTELRELNFQTLYKIFVINRKGDFSETANAFINIKNCLHNIEDFRINQRNSNNQPLEDIRKSIDLWNESLQRLISLYNSYTLDNPPKEDKLMPILNKYIVRKQRELIENGEDQNIYNFYHNLILPMQNEILALKTEIDYRAHPIIEEVLSCKKAYHQIEMVRHYRRKSLLLSGRRLNKIKFLLKESSEKIKTSKPRFEK